MKDSIREGIVRSYPRSNTIGMVIHMKCKPHLEQSNSHYKCCIWSCSSITDSASHRGYRLCSPGSRWTDKSCRQLHLYIHDTQLRTADNLYQTSNTETRSLCTLQGLYSFSRVAGICCKRLHPGSNHLGTYCLCSLYLLRSYT